MKSNSIKTVLDNGVRIITEALPVRTVSVGFWVDVGSRDENSLNNGCAHFVEHMLFKGTTSRSPVQIAMELDGLGGASNAFTSKENTCLYATVLDSQLAPLISIYSDLFLHSLFAQDEVVRESSVILQEIDMIEDTPEDQVHDLFAGIIWKGHPLSNTVLGNPDVVSSMTSARLQDFVGRFYSPENIIIAAAGGGLEHNAFVDLVAEQFSLLPSRRVSQKKDRNHSVRKRPEHLPYQRQIVTRPFEQVHITIGTYGLAAGSPERYALLLLNVLLGGNMSSRLFQEVREKRGLAYSICSFSEAQIDSGQIGIYTGVNPQNVQESIGLIEEIVADFARGSVEESDLERAKGFVRSSLYLSAENMDARMMRLAKNEFIFRQQISLSEVELALAKVTTEEVNDLARRLFAQPMSGLILGPVPEKGVVHW